jgi:hypothetical protein
VDAQHRHHEPVEQPGHRAHADAAEDAEQRLAGCLDDGAGDTGGKADRRTHR